MAASDTDLLTHIRRIVREQGVEDAKLGKYNGNIRAMFALPRHARAYLTIAAIVQKET